jgi:hypothetical protein
MALCHLEDDPYQGFVLLCFYIAECSQCKTIKYINNFHAPDAHFDYSSLFSDALLKKLEIRKKQDVL